MKTMAKAPNPNELAGLTATDCAAACGPDGCVISGHGYCAHPRKGGLHAGEMQDTEALARFGRAAKAVGKK